MAFVECTPADQAWRPVDAKGYIFIHCMYVYAKKDREKGYGTKLIQAVEREVQGQGLKGLCTITSNGSWLADKRLFEANDFVQVDSLGRFELMAKKLDGSVTKPKLIDWTQQLDKYEGWNLVYANQCPWHHKSVEAMSKVAHEAGVELDVFIMKSAAEAKLVPSGFGVFSLVKDGQLLEDHYLSATRFKNILKEQGAI